MPLQDQFSLIARQLQRETQAQTEARHRLSNQTRTAHERSYGSSTVYGRKAIKSHIGKVADNIERRLGTLSSGRAGMDAATIIKHLKGADHSVLALLTMKKCLDVLGKEAQPKLAQLTVAVGAAIQQQLRLDFYFKSNPGLYREIEKSFHAASGTQQRETVLRRVFNKNEITWKAWTRTEKHKIGFYLVNCLIEATGWLVKKTISRPRQRLNVWNYTEGFMQMRDAILERADDIAFVQWPMVCEPLPWSNKERGGYLLSEVRDANPMVRNASKKLGPSMQGEVPIAMLNAAQCVAWKLNDRVLDVMEHCFENFHSIGKFVRQEALPPPASPGEDPTPEQLKTYKIERRRREDENAQLQQRNWRTSELIYTARKFRGETLWYPASLDYRGRMYYLPTVLNPQGTDADKALLLFAEASPVNEFWEAFNVANCFGLDKASMAERVKWTRDNTALITKIATEPITHRDLWATAAEPWCFLSACFSYYETCIAKITNLSFQPIGIDATQSGYQHLCAATSDINGKLVNLIDGDKPQDGYAAVAEAAKNYVDDEYKCWLNRKITKRATMVRVYSGTQTSARKYIREALLKEGRDLSRPGVLSQIVAAIYKHAQPKVFPGPMRVMEWMQTVAKQRLETHEHIEWTSPSGFVVTQDLRKSQCKLVKTRLMGSVVKTTLGDGWGDPDIDHHVSAVMPNAVHSWDAALLHLVFEPNSFQKPFGVIHDCCLARGSDMDELSGLIRDRFASMYSQPVLERWAADLGAVVPDGLIQNTLDIERVRTSTYFFC